MNYYLVSKQNQDVWLTENPDKTQNRLSSKKEVFMLECHRNSKEASDCIYRAYIVGTLKEKSNYCSFLYFDYKNLQEKLVEIANMNSNVFGFKYSEDEIENKWKELKAYVEENNLLHLYI